MSWRHPSLRDGSGARIAAPVPSGRFSRFSRFSRIGVVGLLASTGVAPIAPAEDAPPAAPGSVVRWVAVGIEKCVWEDEEWPPHGDICYFPVDLTRTEDLEIGRRRAGSLETATVRVGGYPYPVQHVTVERRYVELSREDLERTQRESGRIRALWSLRTDRRFDLPLTPPLASRPDARNFGSRRVFNGQPRNPHTGADYSAAPGTPVLATAAGSVALAEGHFYGGNSVFIDHGDGLVSMYMHLSEIAVAADDSVVAGQEIGRVGATGRVSGPHLHFGVRWRGARIDPEILFAP